MKTNYVVYDGRFIVDRNKSLILECIGDSRNKQKIISQFRKDYAETDSVLVAFIGTNKESEAKIIDSNPIREIK